jgi:hydrogenase/urease accessory protein HupE
MRCVALALVAVFLAGVGEAHEVRPSFLELRETVPGEFTVLWKTPMLGEARLALAPAFSRDTTPVSPVITLRAPGAAIQTWVVRAPGLRGQTLRIDGLEGTMTDALVRVEFADGTSWTQRLTPNRPATVVPIEQTPLAVAAVYLRLGVEHILAGVDHLLFVLALLMIVRSRRRLLGTVTAFTVAHSVTLALATLGFVRVPQQPVEATIALSIAFVAVELVRDRRGQTGLTARAPWIVAFAFGLLHGFGFAGALSEIGLPPAHVPLALLCFNLGVEVGQLLFIAVVLGLMAGLRRIPVRFPGWAQLVPPYAIGIVAMAWVIQRVAAF